VKPGDIVRHPDGSIGVIDKITVRDYGVKVHWVANTCPEGCPTGYSTERMITLEPTGARVDNYETL
jgi:hypothetical protein